MKAIVFDQPGDESVLRLGEAPDPVVGAGCVRLRVRACAVNRADLLQRQGMYPPPPGVSPILGLECAGEVSEVGAGVSGWRIGDRAMALLAGGGYAEQVAVHAGSLLPVPAHFSWEQAACLPEVYLTVFLTVFQLGGLVSRSEPRASEDQRDRGSVLVHGGGSGIGTACIQLAKRAGAIVVATAGSDAKCQRCRDLGADVAVNYREGDFVAAAQQATGGRGVDVVLDSIGAPYLERNLQALAVGGRLVLIGLMGGAKAEINLAALLARRLSVIGSTLRARPVEEKAELVAAFLARFGDALEQGALTPVVDRVLPLAEASEAHRAMKASEHFGKIALRV
jgi:putative PIG3 family NAD(P)H quinone oxidoreductase